ncbi:hypothetical protein [Oceanobacillus sojae]|uniref:hypothetical protein n=1 Tax=Oceanobacillus sojae TaxID=582851 RepID=UPI00362D8681
MIHTVELTNKISEKKAIKILTKHNDPNEILELIIELKKKKATIKLPLSIPGIILCSITYISNKYYRIYLRVDLQSLIIGRRTIDLFECSISFVEALRAALDGATSKISRTLPQSDEWHVSRIDFTVNLTSDYVEECVALAKKGNDPYRYKDIIDKSGSSYRKSKSVILNFYDKFDHISKKVTMDSFDAHLLEEATNVYRIEVQCLSSNKLRSIRERYNLPKNSNLFDYLRSDIAEWACLSYYEKVIGKGDYYSLAEALEKIDSTGWTIRRKNNIKNFLKLIAQAKGMTNAKKQFLEGKKLALTQTVVKGSRNTFRTYVKACEEIGVNPVTIPKDWGIYYIPNPINSLDTSKITEIK